MRAIKFSATKLPYFYDSKLFKVKVIITGGTKGIGKALADIFFSKGADLVICARNEEELQKIKAAYYKLNSNQEIIIHACDVAIQKEVKSFADLIGSKWNKVDVLINNAGLFIPGEVTQEEEGRLEQMMQTNLYSAYHLTRYLAPMFIEQQSGHIFNMCSVASKIAYPNGGSYSISKFALLGFSKVLREEMKLKGVKVTAILPGATWSNSWAGVDLPHERLMEAKDIAEAVWSAYNMGPSAVVEEITIRPQLGDL